MPTNRLNKLSSDGHELSINENEGNSGIEGPVSPGSMARKRVRSSKLCLLARYLGLARIIYRESRIYSVAGETVW